jgi:hypothetical protein
VSERIVNALINHYPSSIKLSKLKESVGGNPSTVQQQVAALATASRESDPRLFGWVERSSRGWYRLSDVAFNSCAR